MKSQIFLKRFSCTIKIFYFTRRVDIKSTNWSWKIYLFHDTILILHAAIWRSLFSMRIYLPPIFPRIPISGLRTKLNWPILCSWIDIGFVYSGYRYWSPTSSGMAPDFDEWWIIFPFSLSRKTERSVRETNQILLGDFASFLFLLLTLGRLIDLEAPTFDRLGFAIESFLLYKT